MFHAQVITLFPEFFSSALDCSIPARAQKAGLVDFNYIQLRDFSQNKHNRVDERPYGGGPGMVMQVEPVVKAIAHARQKQPTTRIVLLTPCGQTFNQKKAREYASLESVTFICGRYEGIDARIVDYIDEELSIGEFVLSGGEPAALCLLDSIVRLLPGALGDAQSAVEDSFTEENTLDYPHYTRPVSFEGKVVPKVLMSGNHAEIARWREKNRAKLK
ncbi:MAG: tRNA (guanosine(37)-N1)-methyltransferase TrmD [Mariprofundaceae bacterium]|nr:tRNA (guanosine(37)-N1)-methyltransferase TrmD [Mariprofundaceae bacterium]